MKGQFVHMVPNVLMLHCHRCIRVGDNKIADEELFVQKYMSLHCVTVKGNGSHTCDCKDCLSTSVCAHKCVVEVEWFDLYCMAHL